ncbi:MAG: hypothetical protein ACTSVI_04055 [Promethearchaeota archaeon]
MKNKTKTFVIILIVMIASGGGLLLYFFPGLPFLNQTPYEKVEFSEFPISLDNLFRTGNISQQNELKQMINESEGQLFSWLVPYPFYFHDCHYPAIFKWYLYADGPAPMHLTEDSYLVIEYYHDDSQHVTINGSTIVTNIRARLRITPYIDVHLDHVSLNKSLIDSISSVVFYGTRINAAIVKANTTFGFASLNPNSPNTAVDFRVVDKSSKNLPGDTKYELWQYSKNPFFYFTKEVQDKIKQYYDPYYQMMKENGHILQTRLNGTYNINEDHSIFGNWYYKSGPFSLNESHHVYEWTSFDPAILTVINVNKTNNETFHENAKTGEPFNSSMIGVFGDSECVDVEGYQRIGVAYMYLVENSSNQGIIRLEKYYNNNEWGSKDAIFLKFQFQENSGSKMSDDKLIIEYFDTLTGAQGDFTTNKITYTRDPV